MSEKPYDINGFFGGRDGELEINAGLRLKPEAVHVTTFTEHGETVKAIPARTAGAQKHMDTIAHELQRAGEAQKRREERKKELEAQREANLNRKRFAVPKPKVRKAKPRTRKCTACQGEPGHVEFCVTCCRTGKVGV